jgi:hypothetical protein
MESQHVKQILRSATAGSILMLSSGIALAGGHFDPDRPQVPADCQPNWGYNQTCWRRFPAVPPCDNCPQDYSSESALSGTIYSPQPGYGMAPGTTSGWSMPPQSHPQNVFPSPSQGSAVQMPPVQTAPPANFTEPQQQHFPSSPGPVPGLPVQPAGPGLSLPPLPGGLQPIPESTLPQHQSRYGAPNGRYSTSGGSGLLIPGQQLSLSSPAIYQPTYAGMSADRPSAGRYGQMPGPSSMPVPAATANFISQQRPDAFFAAQNSAAGGSQTGRYASHPGNSGQILLPAYSAPAVSQPFVPSPQPIFSGVSMQTPAGGQFPADSSGYSAPQPMFRQSSATSGNGNSRYGAVSPGSMPVVNSRHTPTTYEFESPAEPLIQSDSLPRLSPASMLPPLRRTP